MTTYVGTAVSQTIWYCTLALLKTRLGISDTTDDTSLNSMIEAVSRAIDQICGRRFYTTSNDETRYFTAEESNVLYPGDLISVTTLATDQDGDRTYETTWAATDYDLEPLNAALDSKPYTRLRVTPQGRYSFPIIQKGVKIVGKFGYASTTPLPIKEACLLLCEKVFKRKDAIFGVVGVPEMGVLQRIIRHDPEIMILLDPYRSFDVLGA